MAHAHLTMSLDTSAAVSTFDLLRVLAETPLAADVLFARFDELAKGDGALLVTERHRESAYHVKYQFLPSPELLALIADAVSAAKKGGA